MPEHEKKYFFSLSWIYLNLQGAGCCLFINLSDVCCCILNLIKFWDERYLLFFKDETVGLVLLLWIITISELCYLSMLRYEPVLPAFLIMHHLTYNCLAGWALQTHSPPVSWSGWKNITSYVGSYFSANYFSLKYFHFEVCFCCLSFNVLPKQIFLRKGKW